MSRDAIHRFHELLQGIQPDEDTLLTVFALSEPANISGVTALAKIAGIPEETRQRSTNTVRAVVASLMQRKVVSSDGQIYECLTVFRYPILRRAALRGRLKPIAKPISQALFGDRHAYGTAHYRTAFEARVALASIGDDLERLLEELSSMRSEFDVLRELVVPALINPFEADWFERLPRSFNERWFPAALGQIEALGDDSGELYEYLLARSERLTDKPASVLALAGIALQRGDSKGARVLSELPIPNVSASIAASIAAVEGRYDEAARLVPAPRKGTPQGIGTVAILSALALVTRGKPEGLELVQRLVAAGSRKGSPFRSSIRVLKHILERASLPDGAAPVTGFLDDVDRPDVLVPLLRMLYASWFAPAASLSEYIVMRSKGLPKLFRLHGLEWLAAETEHTAEELNRKTPQQPENPTTKVVAPEGVRGPFKPLLRMRAEKAAWELVLEGLERLASRTDSGRAAEREPDERVVWRVSAHLRFVEPYLQKRVGSGWSRGRKLAVKHLLRGAAIHASLPPEDLRVAEYAREEREIYGGYPQVRHYLLPRVFLALIGHPRVFVEDEETPVEVLRGHVQLVARGEGNRLLVSIDPPDFTGELRVEREGGRLFVYLLDAEAEPLLKWIGRGLSLPADAQERTLAILGRLSHLMPVQSFEQSSARKVTADARPWLRIAPHASALSVTLSTRPLGESGPHVRPGQGAPTVLGRIDGEAVQADRDFEEERRLTDSVLTHSAVLANNRIDDHAFELREPVECLELISNLRDLGDLIHVEWPHGNPLRLRARVSRKALRGGVSRASDFFLATGELAVDSELSLGLEELLALLGDSPGRFVRLTDGDYIELEQELRDALEGLSAARVDGGRRGSGKNAARGVALPKNALSVLEQLLAEGSGFELDHETATFRDRISKAFSRKFAVPRTLEAELRGYQEDGFRWLARLAELELGACLADDMGLGKTIQILTLLLHRMKAGPALVVAPTSVCDNWRDEITRFAPSLEVRWFSGPGRDGELDGLGPGKVVITSYTLLQQDVAKLQTIAFGTVVLDEAQFIKNAESLRAKAASLLDARMRIAATGTPVENHVGDLFGIFHFLMPELLGSRASFAKRFPLGDETEAGVLARRNLRRLIQPFVLRRTKAQVLAELPQLTEIRRTVTLTPAEATLYESVRRAALMKLGTTAEAQSKGGRGKASGPERADPRAHFQILAEITRLRRLCCHPELVLPGTTQESSKLASFLELVDELVEGRHRALVFSQFVDMLALVRRALDEKKVGYQYLDGGTPQAQRKTAVEAFQAGDGDLFLISLRAGGFGLNLTGADYVIHLDPWWNPAVESQASDRAHRIGQTRPVTVYRLITAQTIEERIIDLHRTKRELADSLLEESDRSAKLTAEELRALLDG